MHRLGPEAFKDGVLQRPGRWVVDFSADWCPYCDEFLTTFRGLAGTGSFDTAIGDLTDLENPLWEEFEVDIVPTVIAFRDGAVVFRADGRRAEGLHSDDLRGLREALDHGPVRPRPSGRNRP
ncbi:MAG: thioredoxin family protein [Thermoplasmata archaeon]|jgi:thioredoxin 1|nr:thioredoxin family protein [Thermoplasmata archaeon]